MHTMTPSTPDTVLCPICRRPLRQAPDRWLETFECNRCGEFSDFSSAMRAPRIFPTTLGGLIGPVDALRRS